MEDKEAIEVIAQELYKEYCRGMRWAEFNWDEEPDTVKEIYRAKATSLLQTLTSLGYIRIKGNENY
jgi:hypothetical protein